MGKLAHFVFVFFFLLSYSIAFNITEILNDFPEYALYNNFLTRTRLADDINSRNTITVLVLRDSVLSQISSNVPLSEIKNELSVHVLLDFYDSQKLHSSQSFYVTTLYQTTGKADRYNGFVNITVEKDGKVGFRSADPASNQSSYYVKTVKSSPYNISVLEIATPIQAPGLISSPSPSPVGVNITDLLVKSNCKKFASLLVSSGVMKFYESQIRSGLTVFSPTDSCFNVSGIPNLKNLSIAEIVSVLKYHALPEYFPIASLKVINEPLRTMASDNPGNFEISVSVSGDSVMLKTGVDNGGILATLIDDTPLCIFTIDHVLLPSELFGSLSPPPPSLLPSPPSSSSPSPSPSSSRKISPSPSPYLTSPPLPSPPSPPSPPSLTSPPSEESPAMSPESDHNHSGSTMTEIPAMINIILAAFALTSLLSFRL